MNIKLIALATALFITTSAQSYNFAETNIGTMNQTWPAVFPDSEMLKEHIKGLKEVPAYISECNAKAQFERNVQLGVLTASGVVVVTFLGCAFAEWLQEFKVRKAEKAKLIARLQSETSEIKTAQYAY